MSSGSTSLQIQFAAQARYYGLHVLMLSLFIWNLASLNYILILVLSPVSLTLAVLVYLRIKPNIITHVCWIVTLIQPIVYTIVSSRSQCILPYTMLTVVLCYTCVPFSIIPVVLLALGVCLGYIVPFTIFNFHNPYIYLEVTTNCILLFSATSLGVLSYMLEERLQRAAFQETKQGLEMKLVIEEQSQEQERLLLSVLPEHVAVKMRQDLGSVLDSQFKKIYMSRHENVSILYADIVGFTAISSTYSASELVKILNELFARFDRLSEKYHQLRIKILGDCYYCISGAPQERPDHAILSVHMGLSMVKAIKYFQQTTNSPVDMRVGIHTGAVLAGVLGQRQWQFDVYSKDVELANKMESSGKPGRVHVSETTLQFLGDDFEVEPGYGEKREETLRLAGLKTYFIVKALKPFKRISVGEVRNGTVPEGNDPDEDFNDVITPVEDSTSTIRERSDSANFKERLRKDLIDRDAYKDITPNISPCTLQFKDKEKEENYIHNSESFSRVSLLFIPLTLLYISAAQSLILPLDLLSILSFLIAFLILMFLTAFIIAESFSQILPECMLNISKVINYSVWGRRIMAILFISILGIGNSVDMSSCITTKFNSNCTEIIDLYENGLLNPSRGSLCVFPNYFTYFEVLVFIASILPSSQLSHLAKILILLLLSIIQITLNEISCPSLSCQDIYWKDDWEVLSLKITVSWILITIIATLFFLARHMERSSRVLYQWKAEVGCQREQAAEIRRRNEALVFNILPPHVAQHFLGNKKRQHEELYSQSYAEVGVLFASMPNFSDFYSEETVNNQGLECLRFLNEVISDFDALMEQPKFKDIIKIKTIGSTYMAASGLNPSRITKADDPIEVRWAHLALLVEFAIELKKALQGINEQSFNHFVLKMGINHGPITAGVIGARKPHYDIWGNTVNVASRMESTGKAGCIQVTEETTEILKHFGYKFEQRGLVTVKGKGQLMTYYLIGKTDNLTTIESKRKSLSPLPQVSRSASSTSLQPNVSNLIASPSHITGNVIASEDEEGTTMSNMDSDQQALLSGVNNRPSSIVISSTNIN